MSDLMTGIRAHVEAEVPPVDVDALVADLFSTEVPRPPTRPVRRPLWAVAGAVLTGVVLGGLLVVFAGGRTEGPAVTESPAVTEPPIVPSTDAITAPLVELFAWESTEIQGELARLVAFDDAFVGHLITEDGFPSAGASWLVTSVDGLNWAPLLEQPQWAGVGHSLGVLSYDGALWTASIVDGESPELTVERLDTIGLGWDPVFVENPDASAIRDVAFVAGPAGMVLFAVTEGGRPVLWVLEDSGFELSVSSSIESLPFATGENERVNTGDGLIRWLDIIPTERGFLGVLFADDSSAIPAALYSPDGRSWMPIADVPDLWLAPDGVAARDGKLQAFGEDGLYRSTDDGVSWTRIDSAVQAMLIAAGPLGWVVPNGQVGIFWDGPTDLRFSTDGSNWEVALEDAPVVHSILVTDDAVLFGASRGGWGPVTYEVWIGRPAATN